MGPRYTRRLQYQPIRSRNHRPYDPLMNSGEDMGDGLNKYPEEFFQRNNPRKKNYYDSYNIEDYRSRYLNNFSQCLKIAKKPKIIYSSSPEVPEIYEEETDKYERSPYLSYDPYSSKHEEPEHMEYQEPDFPMDSFMGRPDEEEIDDRQFFLPLKKQKPQNQLHFDNPLRQSRPSRPNR